MSDEEIVITAETDEEVVRRIRALGQVHPDAVAVVRGADIPPLFDGVPGVRIVSSDAELAREIVRRFPARPEDAAAPPAVVVGDGDLARIVATQLVVRASVPGEPLTLHCVGRDETWAVSAMTEVGPRGRVLWSQVPMRPADVARRVGEIVAAEKSLPADTASTGPTVIVALTEPALALGIAGAVAGAVAGARVAVAVEVEGLWPELDGVSQVARDAIVAAVVESTPADEVMEALFADVAWLTSPDAVVTAPPVDPFGLARAESGQALPLVEQPTEAVAGLRLVVDNLGAVLAAGGVEALRPGCELGRPPVLSPSDLRAMSRELLRLMGVDESPESTLTTLELAHRLPTIAARAGLVVTRLAGSDDVLTFEQVESLAPLVHDAYEQISGLTGNATGSPWAGEAWQGLSEFLRSSNRAVLVGSAVTHAVMGLDWEQTGEPSPREFDNDQLKRLAELEHRRWAIHQRAAGRETHRWAKPWDQLDEGTRSYDKHIMRTLPAILGAAGIEVVSA
ncbi:MAG TPA: hypothetical protein PJ992_00990 [Arachnia sp.]|nr:hypothetical protein [Arachnia sp.]